MTRAATSDAFRHADEQGGDGRSDDHAEPLPIAVLLRGEDTGGRVALVRSVEVRGAEPPCHRHHWEDKLLFVLAGGLVVYVGGRWIEAPARAVVWIPRAVEHTLVAADEPTELLTFFAPAGFEAFYREMDALTLSRAGLDQLVAKAARYGCEITGPHPGSPNLPHQPS